MRCAVISDLHGNLEAFDQFRKLKKNLAPDFTICLGDVLDPFKESKDVYLALKSEAIPTLRGNHEDYTIHFHRTENKSGWWTPDKRSLALVAEWMGAELATELESLPFSYSLSAPSNQDVYFCHASPLSNSISFFDHWTDEMRGALEARPESLVVAGHKHVCFEKNFLNKKLLAVGSLGIPQGGIPRPQFMILDLVKGIWQHRWETFAYDPWKTFVRYQDSGFLRKGAPFSWLLADEILCGKKHVGPFFRFLKNLERRPENEAQYQSCVVQFLERQGRWNVLGPLVKS